MSRHTRFLHTALALAALAAGLAPGPACRRAGEGAATAAATGPAPETYDADLAEGDRAFAGRYGDANGHKRLARARLDEELALIGELGLAGFFLLHWEVLELAKEVAAEVRGRGSPRNALPPGRGRGSSVGSIVCYLTGLSHVDPVHADLSLGRFLNREMAGVPDIDLDFPRDIRE